MTWGQQGLGADVTDTNVGREEAGKSDSACAQERGSFWYELQAVLRNAGVSPRIQPTEQAPRQGHEGGCWFPQPLVVCGEGM